MSDNKAGMYEHGIYRQGSVRISDLSGRKMLPSRTTLHYGLAFSDKRVAVAVEHGSF